MDYKRLSKSISHALRHHPEEYSLTLDAEGWTRKVFAFTPFTPLFNMTGQPAMSLPVARTEHGLPMGMQFVGRFGEEHVLINLAAQLEQAMPWPQVAPLAYKAGS